MPSPLLLPITAILLWLSDPSVATDIKSLDHDNYRERQKAHARLLKRGTQALPQLTAAEKLPGEIGRRAGQIMDRHRRWYYGVLPDGRDRLPWIDMLDPERFSWIKSPSPYWIDLKVDWRETAEPRSVTVARYLGIIRDEGGYWDGFPEWTDYRTATGLLVRDLLNSSWKRSDVIRLLNEMYECEKSYWRDNPNKRSDP